ncbi:Mechanosensory protein 2 [Halotydeus destructor]|nr:Mechanosensory protein 2 [Halotydeus destructor]
MDFDNIDHPPFVGLSVPTLPTLPSIIDIDPKTGSGGVTTRLASSGASCRISGPLDSRGLTTVTIQDGYSVMGSGHSQRHLLHHHRQSASGHPCLSPQSPTEAEPPWEFHTAIEVHRIVLKVRPLDLNRYKANVARVEIIRTHQYCVLIKNRIMGLDHVDHPPFNGPSVPTLPTLPSVINIDPKTGFGGVTTRLASSGASCRISGPLDSRGLTTVTIQDGHSVKGSGHSQRHLLSDHRQPSSQPSCLGPHWPTQAGQACELQSQIERISSFMLTALSVTVIIMTTPLSLFFCIKVVQEYERAVTFRLGRLLRGGASGPGIFFIIPCIDTYTKIDLRTVSFDVPSQEMLSRDSVTVAVDAVVYYRISNATVAVSNVEDYGRSTRLLAATTLRNVLGTKNLSEILSERESISHIMQSALDEATDPWGVKVERVEIKDVRLPVMLQRAMAAEAEAAREARAKVIAAEGEQRASKALREASEVISDSPAALQLRYLQTLNSIAAERNSTIVFPIPMELFADYSPAARRQRALNNEYSRRHHHGGQQDEAAILEKGKLDS